MPVKVDVLPDEDCDCDILVTVAVRHIDTLVDERGDHIATERGEHVRLGA